MQIINKERHPTVTEHALYGFFGEYRFLSNFEYSPLKLEGCHEDGILYATSEHAYMAQKTLDIDLRRYIAARPTPKLARNVGQVIELRPDWEAFKPHAMLAALRAKFRQNPELATKLLATKQLYLEETNNWGDNYWGNSNGEGLNMLGKSLMQVRAELVAGCNLMVK